MIEDELLSRLKKWAAEEGRTIQAVANDLLRQGLTSRPRPAYKLKLEGWPAQEQPGVDLLDRDKLFDRMSGR